ncbi:methyltransferase [Halomarina salina]|uniref:Methyltransferase n=1 Tax=Halomarina salina TaxID=1872699 RepID=A0ABD5RJ71_9EURY|nr:methyltransferase [Halomarina salina]
MNRAPYSLALKSRVADGPATYRFQTADGVPSKESFRPTELLLLDHLWGTDPGVVLCPEANYGVVGTVLSGRADAVHLTETSARAARLSETNLRRNDAEATVEVRADLAGLDRRFDAVAHAPMPSTPIPVAKQRLRDALSRLHPHGVYYLSATDQSGLPRYADCLRDLGARVERVRTDGACALLRAERPDTVPPRSYVTPRRLRPAVSGVELPLVSVPGTFSVGSLDDGTRLLVEAASVEDGDRVLDLCCGYGAIGLYAGRTADCDLWLTDDDRVATTCAAGNLRAAGVDGTVVTADCLDGVADRAFDRVLCNPPTHAGDGVLAELFADAHDVLAPEGLLSVVHHRALDLHEHLRHYSSVEKRRTRAEHVVLEARL